MAKTLYDYYKEKGQSLPTVQDRQSVAKSAGISGYIGSANQNNALLAYLQSTGQAPAPAPAPATPPPVATPVVAPPTPAPVPGVGATATPAGLGLTVDQDPNAAAMDKAAQDALSGYSGGAPDEATIRQNTIQSFQAEIDALDRAAAEARGRVTAQYTDIGNRRVGSQRALLADSGMLGQVGGEAQKSQLETANANELGAAVAASDETYNAQKRSILTQARSIANETYQNKLKAYSEGAAATVDYLKNKSATAATNAGKLAKQAIAAGIDLTDPKNKADATEYAKQLGVSLQTLMDAYDTEISTQENNALDQAKKIAETKKAGQTTLNEGDVLVDSDGKVIAKGAGKTYNVGPGEKVVDANGNVIATGSAQRQVVGNTLLEQDANGNWRAIYTAPANLKSSIVKINGKDYQIDEEGNIQEPQVPQGAISKLDSQAIDSGTGLLKMFDDGNSSAVGGSRLWTLGGLRSRIPGTAGADFANKFNTFKAQLDLGKVGLLKGQGAVSDAERSLLSAANELSLAQSDTEFRTTLNNIIEGLKATNAETPAGTEPGFSVQAPDGNTYTFPDQQSLDNFKKSAGITFNSVGNTKASTPLQQKNLSYGSDVTNVSVKIGAGAGVKNNNPGNLRNVDGSWMSFSTPEQGFKALTGYVKRAQTGDHTAYKPTSTLAQFFAKYAPAADSNNPAAYAQSVAKRLGIAVTTPINQIDTVALATEIARHESNTSVTRTA